MKNAFFMWYFLIVLSLLLSSAHGETTPYEDGAPSMQSGKLPTPVPDHPLISIIRHLQEQYVKESYGVEAGQCFTDADFADFVSEKKTAEIIERLDKDKDFLDAVNSIKKMKTNERVEMLDIARKTYKKTWRELRLNPETASADKLREGQTNAGQKAEKLIAQTVVDAVNQRM